MKPVLALAAAVLLAGCVADRDAAPSGVFASMDRMVGSADRGAVLVRRECASCHAVERTGDSPLAAAPPFRSMGVVYPLQDLQEAFAEGLVTAHPAMPAFQFQSSDIADVIAYLEDVSGTGSGD